MLAFGDGLLRKASWKFTARIAGLQCIRAQGGTEVFQDDPGFLGQCGKLAAANREANLLWMATCWMFQEWQKLTEANLHTLLNR
jgi:hypothetical protein